MRMMEAGRGRERPLDGRTPRDDRDLGAGQRRKRGGSRTKEVSQGFCKELLGLPSMGGKFRRAVEAGGWGHHPGGQLLRAQVILGGEKRVQIDI